jgi:hypothetical protein
MKTFLALGVSSVMAMIAACGSSSSDGGSTSDACVPGSSNACSGVGACSGEQVCNESGTAYGDCACGASGDAGSSTTDAQTSFDAGSSGTWTPHALSGLLVWVDGDNLGDVDAGIADWPDQSGTHDDFQRIGSALVPSVLAGAIGGHSASHWDEPTDAGEYYVGYECLQVGPNTALAIGADNYLLEIVWKPGACTPGCTLATLTDSVQPNIDGITLSGGEMNVAVGLTQLMAPVAAGAHVFGLRRTSTTTIELRIDGVAKSTMAIPATYSFAANTRLTLGGAYGYVPGPYTLQGDVAEVIFADNPSDADLATLESYLKSKYGL